jgi:hypothetical protein
VWQAALKETERAGIKVLDTDRETGYILAKRGLGFHSVGENIKFRIRALNSRRTHVGITSPAVSKTPFPEDDWDQQLLEAIAADVDIQRQPAAAEARTTPSVRPQAEDSSARGGLTGERRELRDVGQSQPAAGSGEELPLSQLLERERKKRELEFREEQKHREEQIRKEEEFLDRQRQRRSGRNNR